MQNQPAAGRPVLREQTGTVSWIHLGDTHLTRPGEQNEVDLGHIVDEINTVYAEGGIDFVFVPGDIADDGSVAAYEVFRAHLDRLKLPWVGIVGDHDVHEKSFDNFRAWVDRELWGAFSRNGYRFLRLNAFAEPRPDSFVVDAAQLAWLEEELRRCAGEGRQAVLLLHCYPSDLKQGGEKLAELLRRYPVLVVDMGHTHYNEISNDGRVIYTATRSTGQIEEGPVGYSVTTIDKGVVSWHFVPLGSPSLVAITRPVDARLSTERSATTGSAVQNAVVRAKVWSHVPVEQVLARVAGREYPLHRQDGVTWSASVGKMPPSEELVVTARTVNGAEFTSAIRVVDESAPERRYADMDQDNAIGAWPERSILGTQLGPNKNGRKW